MKQTQFGLLDGNNFFVSCERVFRPDLWHKPIVVLSNNDGCIIARSHEVKALGIPMGAPVHLYAKTLRQHRVHLFSCNFKLYGDLSRRMMRLCAQSVPHAYQYSVDECFLDVRGMTDAVQVCHDLRRTIGQGLGLPVSIGLGPTRTLAKVANRAAKQNPVFQGVCDVTDLAVRTPLLQATKTQDVWGIGFQGAQLLARLGLHTAWDVAQADPKQVRKALRLHGEKLVLELRGISCLTTGEVHKPKKNIVASRSFGKRVTALYELEQAVATYVMRAARKLRQEGEVCAALTVFLRTNRFNEKDKQYRGQITKTLLTPSADTAVLTKLAVAAVQEIYRPGFAYKKAGVVLGDMYPATQFTADLLAPTPIDSRRDTLMKLMDAVNKKYGQDHSHMDTLRFAATGTQPDWWMRQTLKSPAYTTEWRDLRMVQ